MSPSGSMTSERRPRGQRRSGRKGSGPGWTDDVGLGVRTWVGDSSPAPADHPSDSGPVGPDIDQEPVARKILLDALTGQARSRGELADKLAKRGVPKHVADRLLDRFTEVGLVDDAAFARQWVESRHRSRGLAPRALAQELRRKGVVDETVKEALEQIDESDQRIAARTLVEKKLRSMRGLDRPVATRRLAGLLARKGYSAGLAFAVVREVLGEVAELGDDLS